MFAANVGKILEVITLKEITKVPNYPSYMSGVTNLRGTVLPVADMRIKFGMPPVESTIDTCIVVFKVEVDNKFTEGKTESVILGAIVDAVQEVLEIDKENILPTPTLGLKCNPEFIEGILKVKDSFIMLLNTDTIFSVREVTTINEMQ